MAVSQEQLRHDPGALRQLLFDFAKRWWAAALLSKTLAFAVSVLTTLFSIFPKETPFLIAALSVIAELCAWYSDRIKSTGEAFLRKFEFRDSFGWTLSKAEMSDLLLKIPGRLRKTLQVEGLGQQYFASAEDTGSKRALENLQESAWWSKHLAERAGHLCLALTCVLVIGSLLVLIVSIETIRNFDTLSNIGRVVTSALVLVVSLGLVRLTTGYYDFGRQAAQAEEHAKDLLDADSGNDILAIKALYEYQLARATAPLIPTWVWKTMRDDLNELWLVYRRRSQP